ncbi:hypothetical protein [Ferruginibacter sp. SUN106]|uniref:hypothetical protein n=1 Tax=Ferruginibacter sp. SUN106 TaxID=2978348 RepID=UPI003D35B68E
MLTKRTNFSLGILLGCFVISSFCACTNSETKAADATAPDSSKMKTAPPAATNTMAKDSGQNELDTTSRSRPLLPGH